MFAMASWPSFTSGFLPRQLWVSKTALTRQMRYVRHGELWSYENLGFLELFRPVLTFPSPWQVDSPWWTSKHVGWWLSGTFSLWWAKFALANWPLHFFQVSFFNSCLVHHFPAHWDKLRCKKHNRVFYHIFMALPWITCKISNQKCLRYIMNLLLSITYHFSSLILYTVNFRLCWMFWIAIQFITIRFYMTISTIIVIFSRVQFWL